MYKPFFKIIGLVVALVLFVGGAFGFYHDAHASFQNDFSQQYGLLVHNKNFNREMPRIKALEVLLKYFPDAESGKSIEVGFEDIKGDSRYYKYVKRGCSLELFKCSKGEFEPHEAIGQKDFLNWFFTLKYFDDSDYLKKKYLFIKIEYFRNWLEARRMNYLTNSKITYKVLQDFIYRNQIAKENLNMPFQEVLAISIDQINAKNFHNLKEIEHIQKFLIKSIDGFEDKKKPSKKEKEYYGMLEKQLELFEELETSLIKKPYVLRGRTDFDPEIAEAIEQYNLQDVLYKHTYDYSKNASYRQYNLTTGVKKMHGKVFANDEVLDYWTIISDNNLWDFKYGWVIAGGLEQWQFGGGLCGSSTMVFLPAWRAGLEILERRNHSKYYTDLYPMENIGLDATIYRPAPNLKIRNNFEDPIVFNVIDDKVNKTISVEIIGNKDYRNIRIEGPIMDGKYKVKWIRHFEDFNGKITSEELNSSYNKIQ